MFYKYFLRKKTDVKSKDLATLNKRTKIWKPLMFMLPAMAVLIFFTVYPMFITVDYAIHPPIDRTVDMSPGPVSGNAFTQVVHNKFFMKGLGNSILYAFLVIPITMIISIVISAAITSLVRKYAKGAWQTIFFLPYVTSGVAVSLAFFYLFNFQTKADPGLINQWFGTNVNWLNNSEGGHAALFVMVLKGVWSGLAFQILMFTTAMMGVEKDRYKAASIDGAGPFKQLIQITLPSIRKTTNFLIVVGLIGAIKVFPLALFNNDPLAAVKHGGSTLMMFVYAAVKNGQYSVAGSSAIILVGVSIAFSLVVRNTFNVTLWSVRKGGEIRVRNKIKNSLKI